MPRVGRDAQIDGENCLLDALRDRDYIPLWLCSYLFFVCELTISLVIKCSGLCNSGILDVVGDGSAIRLHLHLGSSPTVCPAEPVMFLQFGVHRLDPAAAAAQAAPGLEGGEVGADALGEPGAACAAAAAGSRP